MILSVVVPVKNAENCLRRCLDSLLVQWPEDRDDYEIICVNDGSTDRSLDILLDYQSKHFRRIKVIDQENLGLSEARNVGMAIAQGEILAFCDADDWIYKGSYYEIYNHAWDDQINLLRFCGITLDHYTLTKWVEPDCLTYDVIYEGDAIGYLSQVNVLPFVWLFFYRRSYLDKHHIHFAKIAMCEDVLFNLDIFVHNPHLKIINTLVYRYTVSENQITKNRDNVMMRKSVEGYMMLFRMAKKYSLENPAAKRTIYYCMNQVVESCFSRLLCTDYNKNEFNDWKQTMIQLELIPHVSDGIKSQFINISSTNYYCFSVFRILYRTIFIPLILPHLPRN